MGAKKAPPGGANKKPRPCGQGADITKFFDRHPADRAPASLAAQPKHGAPAAGGGKLVSPLGGPAATDAPGAAAAARQAAAERTPGGAPGPERPLLLKQLTALQDLVPAESFAMSQDTDAMQVVWHDSPSSSSQQPGRSLSNLGRAGGASAGNRASAGSAPAKGAQELNAIKQRLISAAQRPRDARRAGGSAAAFGSGAAAASAAARLLQSEQLLEGLLARQQQQPAPVAAAPTPAAAQEHSGMTGGTSEPGAAGGAHRTPGTHLRSILKGRRAAGGGGVASAGRHTPASSVQFTLNDSTSKKTRRAGGGQVGSSSKKRQAGQKRKALLDLLDQVENIVHSDGAAACPEVEDTTDKYLSPVPEQPEEGGQAGAHCGGAPGVRAPLAAGEDVGAASDKENAAGARPGSQGSSQKQAGAGGTGSGSGTAGPTGSQQLMPPPGGLQCRSKQPPAAVTASQLPPTQPQEQPQQQQVVAAPSAAAPPASHAQQQGGSGGGAAAGSGGGGGGSSFGMGDEDDEDDALMAQLELELLTQVEQRQAARQAAAGGGLAGRHGAAVPPPPAAAVGQAARGPAGRQGATVHPPAGAVAGHAGTGPAPAAPARLQAAPPAAQHPAAAAQQQQQQPPRSVAAPPQQPQQQPNKALPRSPYDKQARPPAPAAGAAGAPLVGGADAAPVGAAGVAAALQGSDSSWEDDMDADLELLDQFEAAALKERAERSGGASGTGPPSSDADAGGGQQVPAPQQPAVAEGGGGPPAAGAEARPRYPGNREEVHYTIKEIYLQEHEQVLLLYNKYQKRDVYAHLRAPWCDLPYRVGDPVNILAELDLYEGQYHCLLNMERGMLILHPDVLLSGTRITTSNECPRRSFLDERVAGDGSNDKAVKGTLTHNLIQAALVEGLRTPQQLHAAAERVVRDATEALLEVDLTEEAAMESLKQAVPGIMRWMHRFLRSDPAPDSLLGAGIDYTTGRDIRRAVSVAEVVDIEESIWSTKYGVKGMIDVSAQLTLDDPSQQRQPAGGGSSGGSGWMQPAAGAAAGGQAGGQRPGREAAVGPVEIKTGKMHDSHRAQVLLYLLLMEERYGRPLDWGMLWYTTQSDPQLVVKRPMDLACLMAVRNRLAAAIAHQEMPPLSEEKRQCNWCFQQLNCALAHRAQRGGAESGSADSFVRASTDRGGNLDRVQQELAGKYERATGHMTPADCEFLRKWEALVTLEEGHSCSRRPEIWAMAGHERQALGRCVAGLALSNVDEQQLLYTFCRPEGSALECNFQEGEMLLLSVEGQHAAVARGFFYTCSATCLTISLNKPLRKGLLRPGGAAASSTAAGAAGARGGSGASNGGAGSVLFDASVRWRLDRDDVSSTFVRLRGNLFTLFRREFEVHKDPQTGRPVCGAELEQSVLAGRLRQLIVGLAEPCYAAPDPTQPDPTPPGMNSEQHVAVDRVLRAQDYTLVLGMPGAGKTTTIVSMVQALVRQGKSVLLTSYTNSAVDNILMKLAREEVPFVRLGREGSVHPAVRPWVPGGERYPRKTTRQLAALATRVPVFGATCFGVGHAMLKDKLFDVCIIDEAGQMVLPASLGPLFKARSFVLVGDHNQLPPLVTCKEAEAGGLGESLFKRLSEAHPQAVVQLPVQYRMAADIMLLPNMLIYNNALRCGTDGIAQGMLRLAPAAGAMLATLPAWLQAALDPQRRVLFLDTSLVEGARETVAGDALSNAGEAQLVVRLLQAAVAAGLAQEDVGVISPYRSQVALLDRLSRQARLEGVEVLTVDKCQGRDKEAILLSLVRSNAEGEAGKLLADWRRINVAITRAKTKLVLLGDAATLRTIELFGRLVDLTRQRGWYLQLPREALAQAQAAVVPA